MRTFIQSEQAVGRQVIGAFSRYPGRTAFAADGKIISNAHALETIGRMQAVFVTLGLYQGRAVATSSALG